MKINYIFIQIIYLFSTIALSQSADILLNGTVSAENNQIKNVSDPTNPGDAINKGYLSEMLQTLQSQIDGLESQVEDLQSQIDQANNNASVTINGLGTAGYYTHAAIHFENSAAFDGEDYFFFNYGANGWQKAQGSITLVDQDLNPNYIISQILAMVPSDGSVLQPDEFISYFSVGDTFSFSNLDNILTVDDYIITDFNTSINFDVRINDADLEGEELEVSLLEGPESGTLTLNEDSTFTFTPAADLSGEVQLTYQVTDGINTANGITKIMVRPDIQSQDNIVFSGMTTAGGAVFFFDSASSYNGYDHFFMGYGTSGWQGHGGNSLTLQGLNPNYIISQILASVPNDGSIVSGGEFLSYFSVGDTFSFSGQPNVIAVDDYYDTFFQTEISVDVSTNDADLEGEELTVSITTPPVSGTLTLNENNTFLFTPADNFSGEVQFTYQVTDGENIANADVIIAVQPENEPQETAVVSGTNTGNNSINSIAIIYFESNSSLDGQDVFYFGYGSTGWQHDGGGNSLVDQGLNPNYIISQILAVVPSDGSVLSPGEFISYFSVGDTFSFTGLSNILTVDDYVITDFNSSINFDVRTNDADLEGEQFTVFLVEGPDSGTLTLNEDGTFTFVPAADFSGEVEFTYEVTDGENVAGATAIIKVRDENFD